MSDPTIAKVEGLGKQVVDALKVSPALLAIMLFMGFTLWLVSEATNANKEMMKILIERCLTK